MFPNLTSGSIQRLMNGEDIFGSVMQILGYQEIRYLDGDSYRFFLSDGDVACFCFMQGSEINNFIAKKKLEKFTIIRAKKCVALHQVGRITEYDSIFSLESFTILIPGANVGHKLGNPRMALGTMNLRNEESSDDKRDNSIKCNENISPQSQVNALTKSGIATKIDNGNKHEEAVIEIQLPITFETVSQTGTGIIVEISADHVIEINNYLQHHSVNSKIPDCSPVTLPNVFEVVPKEDSEILKHEKVSKVPESSEQNVNAHRKKATESMCAQHPKKVSSASKRNKSRKKSKTKSKVDASDMLHPFSNLSKVASKCIKNNSAIPKHEEVSEVPLSSPTVEEDPFDHHKKESENIVEPKTEEGEQKIISEQSPPVHERDNNWYYQDPQGEVQGPFPTPEILAWFKAGYCTMNLMIRRSCDEKFCRLGDIIKSWGRIPFLPGDSPSPLRMHDHMESYIGDNNNPSECSELLLETESKFMAEQTASNEDLFFLATSTCRSTCCK